MSHRTTIQGCFALCLWLPFGVAGCDGKLAQPPVVLCQIEGGPPPVGVPDAGKSTKPPPALCEGRCCPTAPECFPAGNPSDHSGAECLAQRDNKGQRRWQFRQTISISTRPPGISDSQVGSVLVHRSEFHSPECNAPSGGGGFMQLIDFDHEHYTSRVGFARFAKEMGPAVADGLCFVEDTYDDPTWALRELYHPTWPTGLPAPMPMPWNLKVVNARRYTDASGNPVDFNLKDDRETILAQLDAESGDGGDGFNGVFYLDEATGYMHGYAPLAFILNYDLPNQYNAIPIRETEIKMQVNDPKAPNCAGVFLGNNPDLPNDCTGDTTNLAWGCPEGRCQPEQLTPNVVEGYFLVAEVEQVYTILGQTLCKRFPGKPYDDWNMDDFSCRSDKARFDPKDPVHGLPPGDWCAATNGPAEGDCHDAWKSVSYPVFQAFPVREETCPAK